MSSKKSYQNQNLASINLNEFQVTKEGNRYHCSKNALNIATFQNYTLYISDKPIPGNIDPKSSVWLDISANIIVDQNINKFDTLIYELSTNLYFQLKLNISKSIIKSNMIHIENENLHFLNNFPVDEVLYFPERQTLYFMEFLEKNYHPIIYQVKK